MVCLGANLCWSSTKKVPKAIPDCRGWEWQERIKNYEVTHFHNTLPNFSKSLPNEIQWKKTCWSGNASDNKGIPYLEVAKNCQNHVKRGWEKNKKSIGCPYPISQGGANFCKAVWNGIEGCSECSRSTIWQVCAKFLQTHAKLLASTRL